MNNVGSLTFKLGILKDARECFETALDRAEAEDDEQIIITVRSNLARINEALCQLDKSERLYKDCYLRLGWIARDRGQISGPANV